MIKTGQKGKLYRSLHAMSVVPMLVLGLVITIFAYQTVKNAMHAEVRTELKNIVNTVIMTYDLLYPGDYHLEGQDAYVLLKGENVLNGNYDIIDRLKVETETEITLFYQDTRILTTICDDENGRIIGTGVNTRIVQDVLLGGQSHFYTNTTINKEQYFAYYAPLYNSDGKIVGMVYAGKPCTDVNAAVRSAVFPIILIALCGMGIVSVLVSSYTYKLLSALQKIRPFLSKVSTGNLTAELDGEVLRRGDELSEMGYSALYMQRSIRTLVEQDTLTGLNNRRFADKRLKQTQMQSDTHGTSYVVAIGDIDFFKSVNDTYGHECGDLVLKKVSGILKKHMVGKGFVARWGGEEFLFLYDDMDLVTAKSEMEALLAEIREMTISYDDQPVQVTMTFGLAEGGVGSKINTLLQLADEHLYEGKTGGRNRVIC